jgi:ABC-type uncharacterized transport system auxiliary subunit
VVASLAIDPATPVHNAGFTRVVGAQDGLSSDAQLLIDIRGFEVALGAQPLAHVKFAAKLVGSDGKVIESKDFEGTSPAKDADSEAVFAALNETFGKVAHDLGSWIATTVKVQS